MEHCGHLLVCIWSFLFHICNLSWKKTALCGCYFNENHFFYISRTAAVVQKTRIRILPTAYCPWARNHTEPHSTLFCTHSHLRVLYSYTLTCTHTLSFLYFRTVHLHISSAATSSSEKQSNPDTQMGSGDTELIWDPKLRLGGLGTKEENQCWVRVQLFSPLRSRMQQLDSNTPHHAQWNPEE